MNLVYVIHLQSYNGYLFLSKIIELIKCNCSFAAIVVSHISSCHECALYSHAKILKETKHCGILLLMRVFNY